MATEKQIFVPSCLPESSKVIERPELDSVTYHLDSLKNTLFSQGDVLEIRFHCGNSGQNTLSKDRGGGEVPLIAGVRLTGQLVTTSS